MTATLIVEVNIARGKHCIDWWRNQSLEDAIITKSNSLPGIQASFCLSQRSQMASQSAVVLETNQNVVESERVAWGKSDTFIADQIGYSG